MVSNKEFTSYLKGIVSMIPGSQYLMKLRGTRDTIPASYYYGIWLKHLTLAWKNGYKKIPRKVVEFGPGECFGVGLAAVLSGANEYYGLDVLPYSNVSTNLRILEEMVELFRKRAPRPIKGWPDFDDCLNDSLFPDHILNDDLLSETLQERRIQEIENAIKNPTTYRSEITIKYIVPWMANEELEKETIDFCYSHSVLEYVENLDFLFEKIHGLLLPGAVMSHQVDLSAHNLSNLWNGHRGFSEFSWSILRGGRPYFLTRNPYSIYKKKIEEHSFDIICDLPHVRAGGIKREVVAERWKRLSDSDLNTAGLFIQAKKG